MSNMLDRSSVVVACLGYGGCVIVKRESLIENDAKRLQLCCDSALSLTRRLWPTRTRKI